MSIPLPNLPTDNLYKFMAIFGLILTLTCTILPSLFIESNLGKMAEMSFEIGMREDTINELKKRGVAIYDSIRIRRNIQQTVDQFGNVTRTDIMGFDTFHYDPIKNDTQVRYVFLNSLNQKTTKLRDKLDAQYIKLFDFFNIGFYSGISLSLIGFVLWFRKVQVYQDLYAIEQAKLAIGNRTKYIKDKTNSFLLIMISVAIIVAILGNMYKFRIFWWPQFWP